MSGGTVNKLRFMQKANQAEAGSQSKAQPVKNNEKWSLGYVDPALVHKSADHGRRLTALTVVSRRSYGGANPYIEQVTASIERPRKRTKRTSSN